MTTGAMTKRRPLSDGSPASVSPLPPPAGDILWLGAHKTGSTYLQHMLDQTRLPLAQADLFYIGLPTLRARYTRPLLDPSRKPAAGPDVLPPLARPEDNGGPDTADSARRYLIFDENILGLVQNALAPAGLYPDGAERALQMHHTLRLHRPRLILGVRSFADYLPSLYCETLKSLPFQEFQSFNRSRLHTLSWSDLAERLLAAFPEAALYVYEADQLRSHEAALLSWVTGLEPACFTLPPSGSDSHRSGFSQRAVEAMAADARCQPGLNTAKQWRRYVSAFPRAPEAPGFSPWDDRDRADLDLVYRLDLEQLRRLSRVHMWSAPPVP